MKTLRLSLAAVIIAGFVTAGGHAYFARARGREVAELRDRNDQLRLAISQQQEHARRLAAQSIRVAGGVRAAVLCAGEVSPASAAPRLAAAGSRDYHDAGRETPVAALQTFAWVCDSGEPSTMQRMIQFEAGARSKAAAFFASLPEPVRAQWASVEAMAAGLLVAGGVDRPFPPDTIISRARVESLGAGRVILHLPGTSHERTEFVETPEGWSYVITGAMVDDYLARAGSPKAAAR